MSGSIDHRGDQIQEIDTTTTTTSTSTNMDTTPGEVTKNTIGMMDVINTMKTRNFTNDTSGIADGRTETQETREPERGKERSNNRSPHPLLGERENTK